MAEPVLLLITSTGNASAALSQVAVPFGLTLAPVAFADALAGDLASAAAVWAAPVDHHDLDCLPVIARACGDRPLIVETPTALLDRVWHQLADHANARIFVTPGPIDVAAALMAIRRRTGSTVREPSSPNRRLVEEIRAGLEHYVRLLEQIVPADDGGAQAVPPPPDRVAAAVRGFAHQPPPVRQPPVTSATVRRLMRNRRLRVTLFGGELFADPAWDMLLDLYAATLDGQRLSVSSLCIAAQVPHATAWRRLIAMVDRGLLQRSLDPADGRRSFVSFTPHGRVLMDRYFDSIDTSA